jgi:hypothetical protein
MKIALPACLHTACVATQASHSVADSAPGFWYGLWHGLIFPLAWIASLFTDKVAIYSVPNDGGWYNFGFFLGIVVFGVGASRGGHRVVVQRR